jgi:hypothetical protein
MPETSVDEDGDPSSRKHDVGFSTEVGDRPLMHAIAVAATVQVRTDRLFGLRMPLPLTRHAFAGQL